VDDEDYLELSKFKWYAAKDKSSFYAARGARIDVNKRRTVKMHRQILDIKDSKVIVDHIDGNGLNNQRRNIRACSAAQNAMNRGVQKNNVSGIKGVYWHKRAKKWYAFIMLDQKKIYIGSFGSKEAAANAYNERAKELHGEFSRLNKV